MRGELDAALQSARAGEAEAARLGSVLRDAAQQREREAAGLQEAAAGLGSELAAKTTELARHQLDLARASALLEGG